MRSTSPTSRRAAAVLVAQALLAVSFLIPASAATTVVAATADSWVLSTAPGANRGTSTILRVRNDIRIAYVRFNVPAVPAGEVVTHASLDVFAKGGSQCTVQVLRAANDTWGETTITWNNQPGTTGGVLATDTWTSKGYRSLDVTATVGGMTTPGAVSFVLRHAPGCAAAADATLKSREAASQRPELEVETGPGGPAAHCSDSIDNDGDSLIDFPADPGCSDASDTDETDAPTGGKTVAAAGDIVCSPDSPSYDGSNPLECQHRLTAGMLGGADAVLPLGDLQYPDARIEFFNIAYDPTWGQHAAKSYPVPGNHEYDIPGAPGYFEYWSSKGRPTGVTGQGYHSFDIGGWHVIALNSSSSACSLGPSCAEGSPQNDFLEAALAATTKRCILAYWHSPLFNSGSGHPGGNSAVQPFWDDLYASRADIVLNGHEHSYQRFAKQTPTGQLAANGIRQFIVGTGGKNLRPLVSPPMDNLEFGQDTDHGILRLQLTSSTYSWRFVNIDGQVLDSGGPVACN